MVDPIDLMITNNYEEEFTDYIYHNKYEITFDKYRKIYCMYVNHSELDEEIIEAIIKYNCIAIEFCDYFDGSLDMLPSFINSISFDYEGSIFNQPLTNLPVKLTFLQLGYSFNQFVDYLPAGLTHLTFGNSFNKPVNNLPLNLTYLEFEVDFNQNIDNIPDTIQILILFGSYEEKINKLPSSLKKFVFQCESMVAFPKSFPSGIKEISIDIFALNENEKNIQNNILTNLTLPDSLEIIDINNPIEKLIYNKLSDNVKKNIKFTSIL